MIKVNKIIKTLENKNIDKKGKTKHILEERIGRVIKMRGIESGPKVYFFLITC